VGWICRGGPAPGRPPNLSPARDWAGGGPGPAHPRSLSPAPDWTGGGPARPRSLGLCWPPLLGQVRAACTRTHRKKRINFFVENIPSSIGPQRRPCTTSPKSVDLHLLFRARTVSWHPTSSTRPTFKILTQRGCSRHCGRTCMEPVCLRHPHTANSISLTRTLHTLLP
jgi:hypothetical protein